MNRFSIRAVFECRGFRGPMFGIHDGTNIVAVFVKYADARDVYIDSQKIISRWNTIRLARTAADLGPFRPGHGLLS